MQMKNYHQIESEARKSAPSPRLQPHQIIRHVRPVQLPGSGRKARIQRERMLRLLRVLIRFDATGTGACIYPAVASILKALNAREALHDKPMTWSRRTVLRYLARLRASGIERPAGGKRSPAGWTRRRVLDCSRLLPRESGTFENANLAPKVSKTFHTTENKSEKSKPDTPKPAKAASSEPISRSNSNSTSTSTAPITETWKQRSPDEVFIKAWNVLKYKVGDDAGARVCWIAYRALCAGNVPRSIRYYATASAKMNADYIPGGGNSLTAALYEGPGRLIRKCPRAKPLVRRVCPWWFE